jgi:hypothetical protein
LKGKNNMKKALAMILALTMCLSLAACGSSSSTSDASSSDASSDASATETTEASYDLTSAVDLTFAAQEVGTAAYNYAAALQTAMLKELPDGSNIAITTTSPGGVGAPVIVKGG